MKYSRSIDELKQEAVTWWPPSLSKLQAKTSIIPKLLETRGRFVSLLKLSGSEPFDIFELAVKAKFPGNHLVKHLAVLTDVGGEGLKRIGADFHNLFQFDPETGKHFLEFVWKDCIRRYNFKALPLGAGALGNVKLGIDGAGMNSELPLSDLHMDVIAILLFAAANVQEEIALKSDFFKCEVGGLLGNEDKLDKYVSERYILVSRITGGATANELGQIAQTWAYEKLASILGPSFVVAKNGKLVIAGENITSDVLISKGAKHVGVEVSFQVTTNSTIERKGNEAENRKNLMHGAGNHVAYIIDGAGNFERRSAVSKICKNSDCTVAFTEAEIQVLAKFVEEKLA